MGLDTVELVMSMEEVFGVSISDGDAETLVTPRLLVELIERQRMEMRRPIERDEVEGKVREIVIDLSGIKESEYRLDARFVEDFGMD